MAIMNRVYAILLVVLVVLCQVIAAQSEKTPIGDLSSAEIEEQIQVGPFLSVVTDCISNSMLIYLAMSHRSVSQCPQGFNSARGCYRLHSKSIRRIVPRIACC